QASGIGVSQQCLDVFQELKIGKKHKYIIYGLSSDLTEIVVVKTSSETDYETFIGDLPEGECRYAVYDFEFEAEGGGKRNKIIFASWVPDDAKIKAKMLYASSRDALRRSLVGIAAEVQATDYSEISVETGQFGSLHVIRRHLTLIKHLSPGEGQAYPLSSHRHAPPGISRIPYRVP
ncbi:hypothetical protein BDW22DRAFT_1337022, partial [Trametopsis cervina]